MGKENIFKKIIKENWEACKAKYRKFDKSQYNDAVEKMLNCGDEKGGYACYACGTCGNMMKVCFSCKSSFCLPCGKTYTDNWMDKITGTLYEGMYYRHVILTMPEELRDYFFEEQNLMSELMKTGAKMMTEALSEWFRTEVEVGFISVLHTAGRSGKWNPHVHMIMTSGGMSKKTGSWRKLEYIKYEKLHKKWRDHLFKMMREKVNAVGIQEKLNELEERYHKGLVAYLDKGKMPYNSRGLARYLAKYVVSPPIAISRIDEYDGTHVTYWYNDHETGKRKIDKVEVLRFVGLMVQHILPKGFQRVRYFGLHATCKRPKMLPVLKQLLQGVRRAIKNAYKVIKKNFRKRVIASGHKDPLICDKCGDTMFLYFVWHPKYGYVYDFLESADYEPEFRRKEEARTRHEGIIGDWYGGQIQMLMPFV